MSDLFRMDSISRLWMLARPILLYILGGAVFIAAWYLWFLRCNRRKGKEVVCWIERVFGGHGSVVAVRWTRPSCFRVEVHLLSALFSRAWLLVQLVPRHSPVLWIISRLQRQRETLTFQADLDTPPNFNLEVKNHRWYGRTRRRLPMNGRNWTLEHAGPFVLTTRNDWQRDIVSMMNALVASRECDCSSVSFSRSSPHFSVTVALEALSPESQAQSEIFDVLRELAAGASTARF